MKLSKEELRMILMWGNAVDYEYGLDEEEEKLYDKIFDMVDKEGFNEFI